MKGNLEAVKRALRKTRIEGVEAHEWRHSVVLTGRVSSWDEKIQAGYAATKKGYKGVVNDIEVEGVETDEMSTPSIRDNTLEGTSFDITVIGGGVIGSAIARELSRYDISIALLEKEEDLAVHTSSRNDGMIHPGFAASPGSRKAHYNVRGNRAYTRVCRELGIELKRPGSLILFSNPFMRLLLPLLKARARKNSVDGYKYLSKREVKELEPNITPRQHGAFFLPSTGILSPYKLTIAFAENAVENGADVFLNTVVLGFEMEGDHITKIRTNRGDISTAVVINAAGIWADKIAEYANDRFFSLHGRKGVEAILDTKTGQYQRRVMAMPSLFQTSSKTKGGGLVITTEGNLLVGPTAEEVPYRELYTTEQKDIDKLMKHVKLNTRLDISDIITYFAGIRACTYEEDFIVEASEHVDNLVHAAGIQSPGLASAPAIAEDISRIAVDILKNTKEVQLNEKFNPQRRTNPELKNLSLEERARYIKENPAYGRIVCRCEEISEGEIRDSLRSPIPVTTMDGLKRRARVGAGRCHGGFCTPRVLEIMAEELQVQMTDITKKGDHSEFFYSETKGAIDYSNKRVKTIPGVE
jgi:glycerol-3-phosphate dehydrogenase